MMIEIVGDGAARGRAEIYRDLIAHIDSQTSVAVLGQTLTTQEGQSGSYSLGQVHDRARAEARSDDPIDVAADRLAAGWRPLVEPLTEPILRAAAESEGYDALAARLDSAGLWRGTDRDPLADALYRGTFSARMSGSG